MTYDRCLATLEPLADKDRVRGYKRTALENVFGTQRVQLPLAFDRREYFQAGVDQIHGLSISGVQQKLSLVLNPETNALEPTAVGGEYILKPSPDQYRSAAENEHVAMLASRLVGISTAECTLVAFSDGELAYLTRRFDRKDDGERIQQEDLLQIEDRGPSDKYSISYERAGELVRRATGGKLAAIHDLFSRVLFAYLIGNSDMHMKNISVIRREDIPGQSFDGLAPSYDNLFVGSFDVADHQFLACDFLEDGETTEAFDRFGFFTSHDFLELARRYGLPEKITRSTISGMIGRRDALAELIQASYMPEDMKQSAETLVRDRARALELGLSR